METFSALLAFCAGNSPVTGEFPTQRPVTRSFDVFIDLCLNKDLVNNQDAGVLRRHRAHYDVTEMNLPVNAPAPILRVPVSNVFQSFHAIVICFVVHPFSIQVKFDTFMSEVSKTTISKAR